MTFARLLALAPLAILAACADSAQTPVTEEEGTPVAAAPSATPAFQRGVALDELAYADFTDAIEPGLGCSFASVDKATLMVATAPDDAMVTPRGVVKLDDAIIVLSADTAGGYDALVEGPGFAAENGSGLSVLVQRSPGDGEAEGIESTSWPADLEVRGPGGMTRTYPAGRWSCGA